ncbi:hypothetical protein B5E82_00795 [Lachnoclostridium sp. An138]|nr:hypothetical protein B5E82_00795 [Lachnoclostridium sp. An138]
MYFRSMPEDRKKDKSGRFPMRVVPRDFYKCDIRTPSRNRNIPGRGFRFGFHEKRSARNGPSGSRK